MRIDIISTLAEMDAVKENWQTVYQADPNAHYFVSWGWLRGYFEITERRWFILAAKSSEGSDYVAFFPLAEAVSNLKMIRSLRMGGSPLSDYTGFVCLPEFEETVLEVFAQYVQTNLKWDRFHLRDVLDARVETFLAYFPQSEFDIVEQDRVVCPYIPLPSDWDTYLMKNLKKLPRNQMRKALRTIDTLADVKYVLADNDNFDENLEVLLTLWQERWKQPTEQFRILLRYSMETGALWLSTLWLGEEPIAGLACFVDAHKGRMYSYMGGYDPNYSKLAPGKILDGTSIRFAIEHGFKEYDYLRGDEPYKFRLGAIKRHNKYFLVSRTGLKGKLIGFAQQVRSS